MDRQIIIVATLFQAATLAVAIGLRLGIIGFSALSASRDNKNDQTPNNPS
jgi:hypothetical protein